MNKFTLRFNQKVLELQYQSTRLDMRKQILYGVSSGFIIMNTISAIFKIIEDQIQDLALDLTLSSVAILTLCVIRYYPQYILEGLIILNMLSCLIQIDLNEAATSQFMYIFGANIMATQLMLLFGSDFLYSLPQISIIFCSRIGILRAYQQLDWFTISLTLLVSLWLGVVQYQLDKTLRSQFLLTLKDHNWEQLLPHIVEKPYFYFRYNDSKFEIKQTNKQSQIFNYNFDLCQGCNLRHFLREFKFNNQTIEAFILSRLQNYQKNIYGKEIISKNKKKFSIKINYCEIFSDSPNFLIILNDSQKINDFSKQLQNEYVNKYLTKYTNHLFKLLLKECSNLRIIQLNCHYLSALYLNDYSVKLFSPFKQIKKIINLSGGVKIQCQNNFNIQGYKNMFSIFWLQTILTVIMTQNKKHVSQPLIILKQEQDDVEIQLILNYPKLFQEKFNNNIIIQRFKNIIFYCIDENLWRFKLYTNLEIAFKQINND